MIIQEKIFENALSLPVDVRLSLIDKLLQSLNLPIDEDIGQLWAEEAEKRVSQLEKGEAKLIPGEEVFEKMRSKYPK